MYVPDWPPLNPARLLVSGRARPLPFPLNAPHRTFGYVARNVIYHLCRALQLGPDEVVLMPEYHSGVEVWAVRAAGAQVCFYPVNRQLEPDVEAIRRLCATRKARVLYVIHFVGWPQPLDALTTICREHGLRMIEDCALAMFSRAGGQALGTTGDYAVYCLYKTLPVPHGGLLVQNRNVIEALTRLELRPCSAASVAGRGSQLVFEWIRGRADPLGKLLLGAKRGIGRALSATGVTRLPVGDISPGFSSRGFTLEAMDIGMSPLCHRVLASTDADVIRTARRSNFLWLRDRLRGRVALLREDLPEGVCPLFLPLLVEHKAAVIAELRRRGAGAVGFWNYGHPEAADSASADCRYLRAHVVEMPVHQELSRAQLAHMAEQILAVV